MRPAHRCNHHGNGSASCQRSDNVLHPSSCKWLKPWDLECLQADLCEIGVMAEHLREENNEILVANSGLHWAMSIIMLQKVYWGITCFNCFPWWWKTDICFSIHEKDYLARGCRNRTSRSDQRRFSSSDPTDYHSIAQKASERSSEPREIPHNST